MIITVIGSENDQVEAWSRAGVALVWSTPPKVLGKLEESGPIEVICGFQSPVAADSQHIQLLDHRQYRLAKISSTPSFGRVTILPLSSFVRLSRLLVIQEVYQPNSSVAQPQPPEDLSRRRRGVEDVVEFQKSAKLHALQGGLATQ